MNDWGFLSSGNVHAGSLSLGWGLQGCLNRAGSCLTLLVAPSFFFCDEGLLDWWVWGCMGQGEPRGQASVSLTRIPRPLFYDNTAVGSPHRPHTHTNTPQTGLMICFHRASSVLQHGPESWDIIVTGFLKGSLSEDTDQITASSPGLLVVFTLSTLCNEQADKPQTWFPLMEFACAVEQIHNSPLHQFQK